MFKVAKQTPVEKILKWTLVCQKNDPKSEGIISNKGLRPDQVPEVEEYKLKFEPSGLYKPNKWRNK